MAEQGCRYTYKFGDHAGKQCGAKPVRADGYCDLHSPNNQDWREVKTLRRLLEASVARKISLEGAQLAGADLRFFSVAGAQLQNANLMGANLYRSRLVRSNLTGASLKGANLQGTNLRQAVLMDVNADNADFSDANLSGATFRKASLIKAQFDSTVCTSGDFREALLIFAHFFNSQLDDSDFTNANLTRANLESSRLVRCCFRNTNLDSVTYDTLTVLQDLRDLETAMALPEDWMRAMGDKVQRRISHSISQRIDLTSISTKEMSSPQPFTPGHSIKQVPAKPKPKQKVQLPDRPVTQLLPGDSFGDNLRYKIVRKLGTGGMALVYLVKDRRDPDTHLKAIKIMDPQLRKDEVCVKRFRLEGKIIQEVHHKNIIRIESIEYTKHFDTDFILMEYINGTDLDRLIERFIQKNRTFITPFGASIILDICEGLEVMHARKIIHRDLKPANILMRKDRTVVISDFGLSKDLGPETTKNLLTTPGTILGTFDYMAPEQLKAESINAATDIYSLGVIMYEMFVGRRPYSANTITGWLKAITAQVPEPAHLANPKVPKWLSMIIQHCLAKDPAARFQSITELKTSLKQKRIESSSPSLRD